MAFYNNALNFPNLTSKGTPVGADLIMLADSAASNVPKQATLTSILAAGASAGLTLIASGTASGSAAINFNNNLSSTYDNYLIVIEKLVPASSGDALSSQFGTGATPTYQTTNYSGVVLNASQAASTVLSDPATTDTMFMQATGTLANNTQNSASTNCAAARYQLSNVNDATNYKMITGSVGFYNTLSITPTYAVTLSTYQWKGATVLTSIKFFYKVGNISTGIFKLYGFSN